MPNDRKKWYATMTKKLNTDEEGVRAWMRDNARKGSGNPKPYFAVLKEAGKDDELRAISVIGGKNKAKK